MHTDASKATLGQTIDQLPAGTQQPDPVTHPWAAEGQHQVRFGIGAGPMDDWPALREFVQRAEELGFESYSLADHPGFLGANCWTTLAALAAVTKRIRLAPLVSCVY